MKRYTRQLQLKGFGPEKQEQLLNSKVLVVGAGGLGVPVLQYLTAMGVGTLGIVENDTVSLTNLQRQVLYTEQQAFKGSFKLNAAVKKLKKLNSTVTFKTFPVYLNPDNALSILEPFDLIIDCSDNFETRYLVNDACVILKKPFVYGALHGFEGQVSVFNYKNGPTYRCLFPVEPDKDQVPDCNTNGVLGVIPGIIGSFQALEAIKILTGSIDVLSGKLLLYDGIMQSIQKISIPLKPENLNIKVLKVNSAQICYSDGKNKISSKKFKEIVLEGSDIHVVDVRNTDEYNLYNIPGSLHIPLNELEHRFPEIKQSAPVYLICESGLRSFKALQQLKHLRPELNLFNVEGGFKQYKKEQTAIL